MSTRAEQIREAGARWRSKNRDRERERSRKYQEENPEKSRQSRKKYYYSNRDVCRARYRKWAAENKKHLQERWKERSRTRKYRSPSWRLVQRFVLFSGCKVCGLKGGPSYWYDFHHIDPSTKEFNLGHAHFRSLERVRAEIRKCVVLCALCHRDVHYGEKDLPDTLRTLPETSVQLQR